jgi:Rrf2 family protein
MTDCLLQIRLRMINLTAKHAIKALLELAADPQRWQSVREIAELQKLPEPMLEQLLLMLRRAGVLEARRGRLGGYRLARPACSIPLATILAALKPAQSATPLATEVKPSTASDKVTELVERRLLTAMERELQECSLAELQYDLRSARASLNEDEGLLLG